MTIEEQPLSPRELASLRKVLVIQLGPFGDGLLTTAYFEALKRALPGVELHYLIKEPYHFAVRRHPLVDRLITIPARKGAGYLLQRLKTIAGIRRERYDLVIDQQNKFSSKYITWLSGARYRLGYSGARMKQAYNLTTPREGKRYAAARRFDILKPLGIEEEPFELYFPIPEQDQEIIDQWLRDKRLAPENLVVISPGSRQPRKQWRLDHYAELADLIQTRTGKKVVLLWAPKEEADVEKMADLMKTRPLISPPTPLEQAAALLKRCCLLICNDSGLNHLAVTTHTRTLALFGSTDPRAWSPAGVFSHHHHLFVPGHKSTDNSFGITPGQAFSKVRALLNEEQSEEKSQEDATGANAANPDLLPETGTPLAARPSNVGR